ncbi:MAG: hypothetical protein KIT10_10255 [Flavobacteriales bacterium]|nr:hypothetical protein [Flavobacteriales bacterium]
MAAIRTDPAAEARPHGAWAADLLATLMLALALYTGVRATSGLTWSHYVDSDRDISFVRSVMEGHYGEDPLYLGEKMWFTPLLFAIEAAGAKLLGLDVHVFQARAGAWLNIFAPLAFWLMARRFFGAYAGVASLLAYLCLMQGQEPGWAVATYSPWLLPMIFSQSLFFFGLMLLAWAADKDDARIWALVGAMAGLVFLSHAAPAILLVLLTMLLLLGPAWRELRAGHRSAAMRQIAKGLVAGGMFIIVSLPLTWYVIGDYLLDQKNRVPSAYTYRPLSIRHANLILFHNVHWANLVALVGIFRLWRMEATTPVRLLRWCVPLCLLLMAYAYAAVVMGQQWDIGLPMAVPSFHFYFYLKALLAIGFGVGFWWSVELAMRWRSKPDPKGQAATGWGTLLLALVFIAVFPAYAHRPDLVLVRERGLDRSSSVHEAEMRDRLVALPWTSVVLCDEELSMRVLMASARKTVATNSSMANPYVVPEPRMAAREAMLQGLRDTSADIGAALDAYAVTHLLVRTEDIGASPSLGRWFPHEVYRNEGYALFGRKP